ncbi:MAG: hypothetical protein JOZ55_06185 [Alphaproteobacteria bacterium]|nr:hypothetical protein [Alphaproteobacteria bacterium]
MTAADNDTSPYAELVEQQRFSWGATAAAAVIGVSVTAVLLLLGFGVGLSLLPRAGGQPHVSTGIFSLGAIYVFAAIAFGMAAAGHVVGRLIGPEVETAKEENFRAGAHGLAAWALANLIALVFIVLSGMAAEHAIQSGPASGAQGPAPSRPGQDMEGYLVDQLFRPQANSQQPGQQFQEHSALDGIQFAQADTEGTDASPPQGQNPDANESDQQTTVSGRQGGQSSTPATSSQDHANARPVIRTAPGDLAPQPPPSTPPNPGMIAADKAEVGRILEVAFLHGGALSVDDRDRIAQIVAQDANISYEAATARTNDLESRMDKERKSALEKARKAASFASIWLAAALIFGALVAVLAAISARWEDDMQSMFVLNFRRRS